MSVERCRFLSWPFLRERSERLFVVVVVVLK